MNKPPKQDINGFLLLNKPAGMSSNAALQKVKWLFQAKKAGYSGTLDPFATGMLPICFGKATKQAEYLHTFPKRYRATLRLGYSSTTGDPEGELSAPQPIPSLTSQEVESAMRPFIGEIFQIPPMFSALKHQGRPLYELARKGEKIDRPPRPVTVYALTLLALTPTEIQFEVQSSKGLYVRTLAEDLAQSLGTSGYLTALHRCDCGGFEADQMVDLENVLKAPLLPLAAILPQAV